MSKRLRDPVHGLIVFEETNPIDSLAWQLIDTPEFQRLRRIRQLGVSEFTFPGAVHTRFTHSIGVFHTARMLVDVVDREMKRIKQKPARKQADVALVAALLHDLGHGPFSHTFEGVQDSRGIKKRHEQWTADIIRNPDGKIQPLLEEFRAGFTDEVASLLEKEDPEDIYHAVVSSSFDADRLDYLRRDRLMTGTGAGAIDFDWLKDNIRVAEIEIDAPDEDESGELRKVPTFCLTEKALPAAEQFLLARFTLSEQVYFHKATRCAEQMIAKMLRAIARLSTGNRQEKKKIGLPEDHPLVRFFGKDGETVENYLALDDALILGALEALSKADDEDIADMAARLKDRKLYKTLDFGEFGDAGTQRHQLKRIRAKFERKIKAGTVIIDDKGSFGIYSEIGGESERMHKKLHILQRSGPVEISQVSKLVSALVGSKQLTRAYFADDADRNAARGK